MLLPTVEKKNWNEIIIYRLAFYKNDIWEWCKQNLLVRFYKLHSGMLVVYMEEAYKRCRKAVLLHWLYTCTDIHFNGSVSNLFFWKNLILWLFIRNECFWAFIFCLLQCCKWRSNKHIAKLSMFIRDHKFPNGIPDYLIWFNVQFPIYICRVWYIDGIIFYHHNNGDIILVLTMTKSEYVLNKILVFKFTM